MATLSMMVRAALGHYGGNVRNPPRSTSVALVALVAAEIFRVVLLLLVPSQYGALIAVSQLLWIAAYGILVRTLVGVFWPNRAS